MRVIVRAKLVVGFWYLTHLESVSYKSAEQDTATITKNNDDTVE